MSEHACLIVFVLHLASLCLSQQQIVVSTTSSSTNKTLFQYLQDGTFASDTTFVFLPGHHKLNMTMNVSDIDNLILSGNEHGNTVVNCSGKFGLFFMNISNLKIDGITFAGCGGSLNLMTAVNRYATTFLDIDTSVSVALFFNHITNLHINSSRVCNSSGYGVFAINVLGNSTVSNSVFDHNNFHVLDSQTSVHVDCQRTLSNADKGGNMVVLYTDYRACSENIIDDERHRFLIHSSEIKFGVDFGSTYHPLGQQNNSLPFGGGGLGVVETQSLYGVDIVIQNTTITHNAACVGSNLYLSVYDFVDNSSISISDYSEISYGNIINEDDLVLFSFGAALCYVYGQLPLNPSSCYTASEHYQQDLLLRISNTEIRDNDAPSGHVISMYIWPKLLAPFQLELAIEAVTISNNSGQTTFYISNPSSVINNPVRIFFFKVVFYNNLATDQVSGATVALNSIKYLNLNECNFSSNRGSAISARQSQIYFTGNNTFHGNNGYQGGALNLQEGSFMYLEEYSVVTLRNNRATVIGGAIVASSGSNSKCFFQPMLTTPYTRLTQMIEFDNNTAGMAGNQLYGDIKECSLKFASHFNSSVETFLNITNFNNNPTAESQSSVISSANFRLCPCHIESQEVACANTTTIQILVSGQTLTLTMAAQAFHAGLGNGLSPAIIYARFRGNTQNVSFDPLQEVQVMRAQCTKLNYTVYTNDLLSPISLITIAKYEQSRKFSSIEINFTECPVGFKHSTSPPYGCVCDSLLTETDIDIHCDVDSRSISRAGLYWIGQTQSQELAIGRCYAYCNKDALYVAIDPSRLSDTQCIAHHTGVLCGGCAEGYSLALGTVQCLECTNLNLLLLLAFLAAGVLLVLLLTVFNLTVSTGKLNALLYYANIVKVSHRDLLRFQEPYFLPFSIFINWLNLDFGIETCFFNGLDAYTKAWLQYVFPLYLFGLMGIVIYVAKRSTKVANILPRNTISVLATLILMTFTKILSATVEPIPFGTLHTANGTQSVWQTDGNIKYFGGLHGSLMAFSLFVLLFLHCPYATIVTLHPIIDRLHVKKRYSCHGKVLNWFKGCLLKIQPLFDSYEAPYREKSRYWTGLLLIVRLIVFIVSTIAASSDRVSAKALFIIMVNIILLGLIALFKIYNRTPIRLIETSFIINLIFLEGFLLIVELSVEKDTDSTPAKAKVAAVLVGVAVLVFAGITLRELYKRYGSKTPKIQAKGMIVEMWVQRKWRMRKTIQKCECDDDAIGNRHNSDYQLAERPIMKSQVSTTSSVVLLDE